MKEQVRYLCYQFLTTAVKMYREQPKECGIVKSGMEWIEG